MSIKTAAELLTHHLSTPVKVVGKVDLLTEQDKRDVIEWVITEYPYVPKFILVYLRNSLRRATTWDDLDAMAWGTLRRGKQNRWFLKGYTEFKKTHSLMKTTI